MRTTIYLLITLLTITPVVAEEAEAVEETGPDLSALDRDMLVTLAHNLYRRVAELEARIESLEAQLIIAAGGSSVDDGVATDDRIIIKNGSWVVTIVSNEEPDTESLEHQLQEQREMLANSNIVSRITEARRTVTRMEGEKETVRENGKRITRNKYSRRDLVGPRSRVRQLETERRGMENRIRNLERRIESAQNSREITARLDDGRIVSIVARGVSASTGASLDPNQRYTVTGQGSFTETGGEILLQRAARATAEAEQ